MLADVISFNAQSPRQARDEAGEADGQSSCQLTSKSHEEKSQCLKRSLKNAAGWWEVPGPRSSPRILDILLGWE